MSNFEVVGHELKIKLYKGPPLNLRMGGGGNDELYITNRLGRALKMSSFIKCTYKTVIKMNNLFHTESAQNYYFKNIPSLHGRFNVCP